LSAHAAVTIKEEMDGFKLSVDKLAHVLPAGSLSHTDRRDIQDSFDMYIHIKEILNVNATSQ
jgi:hypothetical protein